MKRTITLVLAIAALAPPAALAQSPVARTIAQEGARGHDPRVVGATRAGATDPVQRIVAQERARRRDPRVIGDTRDAAALHSTPLGLKADGLRLQSLAQSYSQPTAQGLEADGLRLQAIAQAYKQSEPAAVPDASSSATRPQTTPSPVQRIIAQERGRSRDPRLFGVPASTSIQIVEPGGFDWGDAGIGAAVAVALMLLAVGTTLVVRHGRVRSA
jgi:hypothetical protein